MKLNRVIMPAYDNFDDSARVINETPKLLKQQVRNIYNLALSILDPEGQPSYKDLFSWEGYGNVLVSYGISCAQVLGNEKYLKRLVPLQSLMSSQGEAIYLPNWFQSMPEIETGYADWVQQTYIVGDQELYVGPESNRYHRHITQDFDSPEHEDGYCRCSKYSPFLFARSGVKHEYWASCQRCLLPNPYWLQTTGGEWETVHTFVKGPRGGQSWAHGYVTNNLDVLDGYQSLPIPSPNGLKWIAEESPVEEQESESEVEMAGLFA